MKKAKGIRPSCIVILSALLCLSGCQSTWDLVLKSVVDVPSDRFTMVWDSHALSIPICASHPVTEKNHRPEILVIAFHGGGLNAEKAFETGQRFIASLRWDKSRAMLLAPQFLEAVDPGEKGLLLWDRTWREGGYALNTGRATAISPPQVSSYDVIDKLVDVVTAAKPSIRNIFFLGHSAGGQFVLRYAAINRNHERLEENTVSVRYIAANPSSYLYLDQSRFYINASGRIQPVDPNALSHCPGYNRYKYGLVNLYGYAENLSPRHIAKNLLNRPVIFLYGASDTKRGWSLDKSCEAELQGENRYLRAQLYRHHLENLSGGSRKSRHIWLEIPNTGHDAGEIFTHPGLISQLKLLGVFQK